MTMLIDNVDLEKGEPQVSLSWLVTRNRSRRRLSIADSTENLFERIMEKFYPQWYKSLRKLSLGEWLQIRPLGHEETTMDKSSSDIEDPLENIFGFKSGV